MKQGLCKTVFSAALAAVIGLYAAQANAQGEGYKPYYENVALRYDVTEPKKVGLKYDVYAGGLKALNADLELDLTKQAYDIGLKAQTDGFIGSLFPWKGTYSTSGHSEDGVLKPTTAVSRSSWNNKESVTELDFDPNGNWTKTTKKAGKHVVVKRDTKEELTKDAVDMLTGALLAMQNAKNTEKCDGSFPVFDGKRRFNITLKDDGKDMIEKNRYSSFSGVALRCTLKVEPVAGFKKADSSRGWMAVQNHTEERNKAPTIWFARIDEKSPVVPVRMEIASAYGSVIAHLTGAKKQ